MKIPAMPAKILCDKCGKEIASRYGVAPVAFKLTTHHPYHGHANTLDEFDVCNDCWRSVYNSMIKAIKCSAQRVKKNANRTPKTLDTDTQKPGVSRITM